jgi:hypothetical protein
MLIHVRAPEQMLCNVLLLVTVLVLGVAAACKGLNSTKEVLRTTRVKN